MLLLQSLCHTADMGDHEPSGSRAVTVVSGHDLLFYLVVEGHGTMIVRTSSDPNALLGKLVPEGIRLLDPDSAAS